MRKTIMILLPHMRGEQIIQRRDLAAPGQFQRYFQPFRMLVEHRVHDADERFVAVENAVPPGQQIAFQPALALMLAQHGIHHTAGGRQELVVAEFLAIPLAVGCFEYRRQQVRQRLVRAEETEIAPLLVQRDHIAQEQTQDGRIAAGNGPRRRHIHGMYTEIRHAQIAQKHAAIGVRIGTHPAIANRCQFRQRGDQAAGRIE